MKICASIFLLFTLSFAASQNPVHDTCDIIIAGAGIGGVYVAYRLAVDAKRFPGKSVCVFEARARGGGRILSVKNAVPGFKDYTIDLGAYRYLRAGQKLAYAVSERVLNLEYLCYTDPLAQDFPDCKASAGQKIFSTRGKIFGVYPNGTDAGTVLNDNPSILPYMLPKIGPVRDPFGLLFCSNSPVHAIQKKYGQLMNTKDYAIANRLVDEMLADMLHEKYKGASWTEVTLWQMSIKEGITTEEITLAIDQDSVATADLLHSSVFSLATYTLREIALGLDQSVSGPRILVSPAVRKSGRLRRSGMNIIVRGLIRKCLQAGVRLNYNTRVVHISKLENGMMSVTLSTGQKLKTGNIFLNMPRLDVATMGLTSEPLKSGTVSFLKSFERMTPITLSKMYCFWEDAWWITKLNLTNGIIRTADQTNFMGRYHDGDVTCEKKSGKCRGALLVSYIGGATATSALSGASLHAYNQRVFSPWRPDVLGNVRKLIPGKMTEHEKILFDETHRQLRKAHRESFKQFGHDVDKDLKEAKGCVYADWFNQGMHVEMGPIGPYINPFKLFTKPVPSLNISLVNEGWSDYSGWAEGSLRSAERALYHVYKLRKPSWIDDIYYNAVIKKFNRG